jgi:hypothetical protein
MKTIRKSSNGFFPPCTLESGALVHPECVFRDLQGRGQSHIKEPVWVAKRFLPFGANPINGHSLSLRAFHNCMNKKLHRPANPEALRSRSASAALRHPTDSHKGVFNTFTDYREPGWAAKRLLPFGANPINGHLSGLRAFDNCLNKNRYRPAEPETLRSRSTLAVLHHSTDSRKVAFNAFTDYKEPVWVAKRVLPFGANPINGHSSAPAGFDN